MNTAQCKRVGCICLMISMVLFLAGCAKGTFYVKVNEDSSADFDYSVGFDRSLLGVFAFSAEDFISHLEENMQVEGYDVSLFSDGSITGVRLKRHIDSLYEENLDFGIFDFGTIVDADAASDYTIGGPTLLLKDRIWHTEYALHGSVDLSSIKIHDKYSLPLFENSLLNRIDLRFILTLPIVPEHHNATYVRDDGHTLEWILALGKNNVIEMEGIVPNIKNRIYFVVVVFLSGMVGYLYYRYAHFHGNA